MVKVRLQGTTNEIKRMRRIIERNRNLKVLRVSEVLAQEGEKKYSRQYMNIGFELKRKED